MKITRAQILEIRDLMELRQMYLDAGLFIRDMSPKVIGRRFGVSSSCIYQLCRDDNYGVRLKAK